MQPTPCVALGNAGLRVSPSRAVRGPSFLWARDGADGNAPASVADPGGGRMALFMVQPETRWPHDRARLSVSAAAPERDSRTVTRVTIPMHGADTNGALKRPIPHCVPRRPVIGVQPVPGALGPRAATRGTRDSRPDAERSPVILAVRNDPGSNVPVSFADPGRVRVILSSVRPETRWPHHTVRPMAKAVTRERDSRTVKQVTFSLHGANHNGAPQASLPAPRPRTPCDRRPAGPRLPVVACSNAGHARQPSRRRAWPHSRSRAASRHRLRHSRPLGSDATGCSSNHPHFHRD